MRRAAPLAAVLLSGCGDAPSLNPVSWWHNLEGGAVAQDRPPPPNDTAPYPNLLSVPDKPPPPDTQAHARVADGLIADRANALYEGQAAPIRPLPPAPRPPGAAPGPDEGANASLAAASAAPAPAVAPRPAPVPSVTTAALPPPPPEPGTAPLQPTAPTADLPVAPPSPPRIEGVPQTTAPTAPPATPPAAPAVPLPPSAPVALAFPNGSAVLPAETGAKLRALAQSRGARNVLVTGYGDATSEDPTTQAAALPLGLDRARAIAAALQADGVPPTSIRISAEPLGNGAAARLVD